VNEVNQILNQFDYVLQPLSLTFSHYLPLHVFLKFIEKLIIDIKNAKYPKEEKDFYEYSLILNPILLLMMIHQFLNHLIV
jgi:hypothetical protein